MKRIAGIIQPGSLKQTFYVYEDGNKIDAINVSIEELPSTILILAEKYTVSNVFLFGIKQWTEHIKLNIQKQEIIKYNKTKLNIVCL